MPIRANGTEWKPRELGGGEVKREVRGKGRILFPKGEHRAAAAATTRMSVSMTFTNTYINILHTTVNQGQAERCFPQTDSRLRQLLFLHKDSSNKMMSVSKNGSLCVGFPLRSSVFPLPPAGGSVCPVWRTAIGGFGGLRLWLQGAGLATLARATLPVLLEVVM